MPMLCRQPKLAMIVLVATMVLGRTAVAQDTIFVRSGFLKGESYLEMKKDERVSYIMGVVDGMSAAPYFGAPDHFESFDWLGSCTDGMTNTQVEAIVTKHLRNNPGQWHMQMNMLTINALRTACPKKTRQ